MKNIRTEKKHEARINKSVAFFSDMNDNGFSYKAKAVNAANAKRLLVYAARCGYEVDFDDIRLRDGKYTLSVYEYQDGCRAITLLHVVRRPHICKCRLSRAPRL